MAGEVGKTAILGLAVGVGVGIGLAVLAPSVFPQAARAARPYAKKAAKTGLEAYLRAREGLAEFGEFAEDVVAEARHELASERMGAAGASASATASATAGAAAATGEPSGAAPPGESEGAGGQG